MKKRLWFKAKTHGWGWTPSTWEGWAVTLAYVAYIIARFSEIDAVSHSVSDTLIGSIPHFVFATIALIAVCMWKSEKPHWRWGGKK